MTVKPFQTGHGGAGTVEMELEPTTLRKHDKSGSVPPSRTVGLGPHAGLGKLLKAVRCHGRAGALPSVASVGINNTMAWPRLPSKFSWGTGAIAFERKPIKLS